MKFRTTKKALLSMGLIASVAVAGSYTPPAAHIATPVGSGVDGVVFYAGGALSTLNGYYRNQTAVSASGQNSIYNLNNTGSEYDLGNSQVQAQARAYSALLNADYTGTVTSLKLGGEAHLGMYFGLTEGFGLGLEVFGVTRTSFNPSTTFSVVSADATVAGLANAEVSTSIPTAAPGAVYNVVSAGLNIKPTSLGYGLRVQPTVMISDQFGVYASVGYGSQKWEGSVNNSVFFAGANQYTTAAGNYADAGVLGDAQSISKNFSGLNYGLGSIINIDDSISFFTAAEVQTFSSYTVNKVGATIAATAALPEHPKWTDLQAAGATGVTVDNNVGPASVITLPTAQLVDASTAALPSKLSLQLYTFSVGIDYAFA